MRTNIVIDDVLMKEALARTGLPTKRAAVEKGLRLLISLANQQAVRDLAGKIRWVGDLDAMRENRTGDAKDDAWAIDDDAENGPEKA
jgi:Arc/MetJ family transcription regulator